MNSEERVKWVYSATSNKELIERYNEWAGDYDQDLNEVFGWIGPQRAADLFARYVPQDASVLDAGCGTGLVGQVLSEKGYASIVGMDMSPGMMEQAKSKKVYRDFRTGVLGERLDFDDNAFDAVVSVGVFTLGHAPAEGLRELVRVTRPGGHVTFTLRPDLYEESGFRAVMSDLESAGRWKLVEKSEPFQTLPKGEPEVEHQVWVYEVL